MPDSVTLSQPDPNWSRQFEIEASKITAAYGPEVIIVHHIGSTAIPDITARPTIDMLVEVRQIEKIDALNELIEKLGYQPIGEHGIPGRRFFIRNEGGQRTHNLYVFPTGHPAILDCLNFRDYLIAHPQQAMFYSLLKRELVRRFPDNVLEYMRGKEDFIREVLRRAEIWRGEAPQADALPLETSPENDPAEMEAAPDGEAPNHQPAEGQANEPETPRKRKGPRYFPRRKRAAH